MKPVTVPAIDNKSAPRVPRRGLVLVAVLVCLAIAMVLFASSVRTLLLQRQQVRAQQDRMQAEYLADSALRRAAARLAADPSYQRETWLIDAPSLAMPASARVEIRVEPSPDGAEARRIRAVADVPDVGVARARRSKDTRILLSVLGKAP